ncbi:MAG TPA: 3-carboxy-cis,cis-muconate cycloisomerase, partial [Thalassospira sp.]|nr:3-carboxy-cis,cis-muconate cycloisomerase [Thalassospira sp.]
LVKDAIAKSAENASNLFDELPKLTDAPVDWAYIRNPVNYVGQADVSIDRVLGATKRGLRE